ncbi:ATP-binding protein [Kribbella sp. HUAS MG21]|uniref:histidine kinase n=1 Tax=Kribbella sp. HUAS MG21 TaxID=3160966 RepID=A0AAU7T6I1_9ACTN
MRPHLTARSRLTLLYTGMVLAAGIVLTTLTYLLMRRALGRRLAVVFIDTNGPGPGGLPPLPRVGDEVRQATLSEFLTQAAIALTVVVLLAAVLGWLVAGRVLRPIRTISSTARRLSVENLSERVPVTAPTDELTTLAGTINGMLDRIQQGISERDRVLQSQQLFTANAAHELRTPLTTMRTAIDVTLDGRPDTDELLAMTRDIKTAVEHSQRTLDGLLALARSQAGAGPKHSVDLGDIVTTILDHTAAEVHAKELVVRTDLLPAVVAGVPVLLERMVGNLIDNAIAYNHVGGRIDVTTGCEDGHAVLRIANTGPVIAPDTAHRLLEPFVRGDGARLHTEGGAGLGLSIVHNIATAHGATLTVEAAPTGGLRIAAFFPLGRVPGGEATVR